MTASIILVLTHGFCGGARSHRIYRNSGTIGGAGRAPEFETASAAFVVLIGIWLLYNAIRHRHHDRHDPDGRVLAFATGLVPCPLTTFITVYAVSNGIIIAGLLLTAGMVATVSIFAVAAVLLRERIVHLMDSTARTRERI